MFKTLDDLKKNEKQEKKQSKTPNSYTGGEASGLAVENPEDRKNVEAILNQAQTGSMKRDEKEPPKTNCKITLYSNGFRVNDEEFRDYSEPQNRQFMSELKQERVPQELRQKFPNGLYVGLEDRTSEAYTPPPPPPYVNFQGQGVTLGGPQAQQQQQIQQIDVAKQSSTIKVNTNKPVTTVVVRLQDGQVLTLTVNLDTTVNEIYEHVRKIVNPGTRKLNLIAGFPPKAISNLNQTVEEADIADSEIRQTLT